VFGTFTSNQVRIECLRRLGLAMEYAEAELAEQKIVLVTSNTTALFSNSL
jgi:hypothetical protein